MVVFLLLILEPGDVVLADRGFDIADDIALHGAKLEIPSFNTMLRYNKECGTSVVDEVVHGIN